MSTTQETKGNKRKAGENNARQKQSGCLEVCFSVPPQPLLQWGGLVDHRCPSVPITGRLLAAGLRRRIRLPLPVLRALPSQPIHPLDAGGRQHQRRRLWRKPSKLADNQFRFLCFFLWESALGGFLFRRYVSSGTYHVCLSLTFPFSRRRHKKLPKQGGISICCFLSLSSSHLSGGVSSHSSKYIFLTPKGEDKT